jgi:hypothetical protein
MSSITSELLATNGLLGHPKHECLLWMLVSLTMGVTDVTGVTSDISDKGFNDSLIYVNDIRLDCDEVGTSLFLTCQCRDTFEQSIVTMALRNQIAS